MTDSTSGTNFPFWFSSFVRRDKAPSSFTFFLSVVLGTSYDGHDSFYTDAHQTVLYNVDITRRTSGNLPLEDNVHERKDTKFDFW